MFRNFSTETLVLNSRISGENNKNICMLSADEGILYATLYGGPKSKLRSLVSPWNRGIMYLYRDQVKKSCKITDFDVKNYHPTFRENLFKTWAASLAAELVIKTRCGGSPRECWILTNGFLDGMDLCPENSGRLGLIRFLWRFLGLLGVRPDAENCASCGKPFLTGNFEKDGVLCNGAYAVYSATENGFLCADCFSGGYAQNEHRELYDSPMFLGKTSLNYLRAVSSLEPKAVRALTADTESFNEMKRIVFYLAESAVGSKLKSIESGMGIL